METGSPLTFLGRVECEMFSTHFLLPAGFSWKIVPRIFKIKRERKKNVLASIIKFENSLVLKLSPKSFNLKERFPFVLAGTESGP